MGKQTVVLNKYGMKSNLPDTDNHHKSQSTCTLPSSHLSTRHWAAQFPKPVHKSACAPTSLSEREQSPLAVRRVQQLPKDLFLSEQEQYRNLYT